MSSFFRIQCQKWLKSVHCWRSYSINKNVIVFLGHIWLWTQRTVLLIWQAVWWWYKKRFATDRLSRYGRFTQVPWHVGFISFAAVCRLSADDQVRNASLYKTGQQCCSIRPHHLNDCFIDSTMFTDSYVLLFLITLVFMSVVHYV